jgi:hypothetical protein
MDLGDPMLEGCPFDFILDLAITQGALAAFKMCRIVADRRSE